MNRLPTYFRVFSARTPKVALPLRQFRAAEAVDACRILRKKSPKNASRALQGLDGKLKLRGGEGFARRNVDYSLEARLRESKHKGTMRMMRQIVFSVLVLVPIACLTVQADASILTIGDANYVGLINDGIPSNPSNEVGYINTLTTLAPGAGPTAIDSETYDRIGSTLLGPFDPASLGGEIKDESGDPTLMLISAFQYLLGKYAAGNAGSLVWYFPDGISGEVTLPSTLGRFGLSHISAYNAVDGPNGNGQIPEPASVLVWSGLTALVGLMVYRRRRHG